MTKLTSQLFCNSWACISFLSVTGQIESFVITSIAGERIFLTLVNVLVKKSLVPVVWEIINVLLEGQSDSFRVQSDVG